MVRPIMKNILFLSQPSQSAARKDLAVADDLLDTLKANAAGCVGMAANMIGVQKRTITVNTGIFYLVMFNPEITKQSGPYEAEEGCLSLMGVRKITRYQTIQVRYQDRDFRWHTQTFTGCTAQIIQHEVDHCNGVII